MPGVTVPWPTRVARFRRACHRLLDAGPAVAQNARDVVPARNVLPLAVGPVELFEQGPFRTPPGAVGKQGFDDHAIVF